MGQNSTVAHDTISLSLQLFLRALAHNDVLHSDVTRLPVFRRRTIHKLTTYIEATSFAKMGIVGEFNGL